MLLTDEQHRAVLVEVINFTGGALAGSISCDLFGYEIVQDLPSGLTVHGQARFLLDRTLAMPTSHTFVRLVTTVDPAGSLSDVHDVIARLHCGAAAWIEI